MSPNRKPESPTQTTTTQATYPKIGAQVPTTAVIQITLIWTMSRMTPGRQATCTTLESTRMWSQRPQGQRHTGISPVQKDQLSHAQKTTPSRSPGHMAHTVEIHTDSFTRPHGHRHTAYHKSIMTSGHILKTTQSRSPTAYRCGAKNRLSA